MVTERRRFDRTHSMLVGFGLSESDLRAMESGEVEWGLYENEVFLVNTEGGNKHLCRLTDEQVKELLEVFRFESRSTNEKRESEVFASGDPDDWAGVSPHSNWQQYVDSYLSAARVLAKGLQRDAAEPYLFICRHTLELMLKAIVMLGQQDMDLTSDLPVTHDLAKLWTRAFPIIKLSEMCDDHEIGAAKKVVNEYHQVDQNSYSFRYPVTTNNARNKPKEQLPSFRLSTHADLFGKAAVVLTKVISKLKQRVALRRGNKIWKRFIASAKDPTQSGD